MRGLVAALGAVLVCGISASVGPGPAIAKQAEEFTVGQWAGYSYTDNNSGQFTDCTVWAINKNNVQVGFSVNKNWNLELWLNSKAWNLPDNESYPISYWIDRNPQYHGKAATSGQKFVVISVERGQDVFEELRGGSQLTFRTQADDYIFDLSGSSAALTRLLDCVDQYSKETTTNPFGGGGSGEQQSNASQGSQQGSQPDSGSNQQQSGGTEQGSSNSLKLKELTQSSDQVRQFLVDVTGAKPSMITVDSKADKSGAPYYHFSTPIGAGEFWQEHLGGDALQDVALGYLDSYKKDCTGEYAQDPKNPVQGDHGQLATGTAACSNSPYQEGPEVLSYAMTVSDDVISIYVTYVGGNAAKAKTDSLGKLIAKRSEDVIK